MGRSSSIKRCLCKERGCSEAYHLVGISLSIVSTSVQCNTARRRRPPSNHPSHWAQDDDPLNSVRIPLTQTIKGHVRHRSWGETIWQKCILQKRWAEPKSIIVRTATVDGWSCWTESSIVSNSQISMHQSHMTAEILQRSHTGLRSIWSRSHFARQMVKLQMESE